MRDALGDGYTETLRKAWQGEVPESADFVMYWWQHAAEEKSGRIRYLRPDYQNPTAAAIDGPPPSQQSTFAAIDSTSSLETDRLNLATPTAWPLTLSAQVTAIQRLLPATGADAAALAACFGTKSAKRTQQIAEILATLKGLGRL